MKLTLDVDSLTFGDMEDFENHTGSALMETIGLIGDDGDMSKFKMKDLVALIWICGRATDPAFTLDDARKVRMSEVEFTEATPDPTPGSAT